MSFDIPDSPPQVDSLDDELANRFPRGLRIFQRLATERPDSSAGDENSEPSTPAEVHKKLFARLRRMEQYISGKKGFGDALTFLSLDFLARFTQRELQILLTNAELMWSRQVNRWNYHPDFETVKPVSDPILASEYGSYWLTFSLTERGRRALQKTNQKQFFTELVLAHINSLTVSRTKDGRQHGIPWNPNETHVAFAAKDHYWLVVHVGDQACKIKIFPGSTASVHEHIWQQLDSSIWRPFNPSRKTIEEAHRTNLHKTAWQQRVEDSTDLMAADMSIVIVQRSESSTLDELQNDPRHLTALGKPHSWRIQVDANGNILDIDLKTYHPTTDGATQLEEAHEVVHIALKNTLIKTLIPQPLYPNLYPDQKTVVTQPEYFFPVSEVKIEAGPLRARTNEMFSRIKKLQKKAELPGFSATKKQDKLLSKLLQIKITPHLMLQLAGMMTLNIEHSHFLEMETVNKRLNPAILAFPHRLFQGMQEAQPIQERDLQLLANCLMDFQGDRDDARNGLGMAAFYATLTVGPLRKPLQFFGNQVDKLKTDFLTNSTLFSMLVGGRDPFQTRTEKSLRNAAEQKGTVYSPFLVTSGFTTAFSEIYQNAFGMCDTEDGEKIIITLRSRDAVNKHQNVSRVSEAYVPNLEIVLRYFERLVSKIEEVSNASDQANAMV